MYCLNSPCSACAENDQIRYVDSVFDTKRPGVGIIFVYMVLEGCVFFLLTLAIEVGVPMTTLLIMGRYYNITMCHYWDMSVK